MLLLISDANILMDVEVNLISFIEPLLLTNFTGFHTKLEVYIRGAILRSCPVFNARCIFAPLLGPEELKTTSGQSPVNIFPLTALNQGDM